MSQKFEMYSGDTKNLIITINEASGEIVPLTGATITWDMGNVAQKTIGNGITVTGEGEITVTLNPIDTIGKSGNYRQLVVVTDSQGNISTVLRDMIEFVPR